MMLSISENVTSYWENKLMQAVGKGAVVQNQYDNRTSETITL